MSSTEDGRIPDADTIKMFMGQISKTLDEENLKAYLSEYGQVYEVKIIRDKITGASRGCAFVTFYTRKDALTAQMALHNLKTMPGLAHPIQMTPADGPAQKSSVEDRRLFIGKLSKTVTEEELKEVFSQYGEIEDMYVVREMNDPKLCKGCAFVTYVERESAMEAIKNLHMIRAFKNHVEPIVVKVADTQKDKERKKNQVNQKLGQPTFQLPQSSFVSNQLSSGGNPGVMPSLSGLQNNLQNAQLQQFLIAALATSPLLQSNTGGIANLLSSGLASPTHATALQQQLQVQQTAQSPTSMASVGPAGSLGSTFSPHQSTTFQNSMAQANAMMNMLGQSYGNEILASYGLQSAFAAYNQQEAASTNYSQPQPGGKTKGPEGSNLFIYHLPLECRDHDLYQMFSPWGNVLSATVFMDKKKNESKCFGFVSYDNAPSAELAIKQMNGFQVGSKRLKVSLKTNNPKPY